MAMVVAFIKNYVPFLLRGAHIFPNIIIFSMLISVLHCKCMFWLCRLKEDGSGSAYDKESMAIIKLNNTTVLYLKEVTRFLALVCILREESFERKGTPQEYCYIAFILAVLFNSSFCATGLIDYNFHCFRKAIHEVFEVGVSTSRTSNQPIGTPLMKTVALNGTPRSTV